MLVGGIALANTHTTANADLDMAGIALGNPHVWDDEVRDNVEWSNAINWYPNAVPHSGDDVFILDPALNYPVLTGNVSITTLTMGWSDVTNFWVGVDLSGNNLAVSGLFEISDDYPPTDRDSYVEITGSGTLSCGSFTIITDDGCNSTFRISNGAKLVVG